MYGLLLMIMLYATYTRSTSSACPFSAGNTSNVPTNIIASPSVLPSSLISPSTSPHATSTLYPPPRLPSSPGLPSGSVTNFEECTTECNTGFYCNINNTCSPHCHSWEQDSHHVIVIIDAVILISVCIGIISGIAVFIIAGKRRKHM